MFKIKHKETGLFFAGFAIDGSQIWNDNGMVREFEHAKAQAILLVRAGANVQRKPVAA